MTFQVWYDLFMLFVFISLSLALRFQKKCHWQSSLHNVHFDLPGKTSTNNQMFKFQFLYLDGIFAYSSETPSITDGRPGYINMEVGSWLTRYFSLAKPPIVMLYIISVGRNWWQNFHALKLTRALPVGHFWELGSGIFWLIKNCLYLWVHHGWSRMAPQLRFRIWWWFIITVSISSK